MPQKMLLEAPRALRFRSYTELPIKSYEARAQAVMSGISSILTHRSPASGDGQGRAHLLTPARRDRAPW
jgi:hypothetical protein